MHPKLRLSLYLTQTLLHDITHADRLAPIGEFVIMDNTRNSKKRDTYIYQARLSLIQSTSTFPNALPLHNDAKGRQVCQKRRHNEEGITIIISAFRRRCCRIRHPRAVHSLTHSDCLTSLAYESFDPSHTQPKL